MYKSLVSIIIPTYNRKIRLISAVKSIINQTYRPLEVIIVNDGLVDVNVLLENLVANSDQSNITFKFLNNEFNSGACVTRNKGISIAEGKYLTLCDDDDEFEMDRIERLVNLLEKERVNVVFSDAINRFNDYDQITKLPQKVTYSDLKRGNSIGAQTLTYTKFSKEILFDSKFVASQDHDYNFRLLKSYGVAFKDSKPSYISNQYECENRVSNNKIIGNIQFYMKHKKEFSVLDKIVFYLKLLKNYATS